VGKVLWIGAVALVLLLLGVGIAAHGTGDDPSEPLLDESVAMVMVCGKQPTRETVNTTAEAVVRFRWAGERWTRHKRDGYVVYYHHLRNGDWAVHSA
jgi:hypothetical protein